MDAELFCLYWLLRKEKITNAEEKAREMKTILQKYPYWQTSQQHEREIKIEFIRVLFGPFNNNIEKITEFINTIVKYLKKKDDDFTGI